MSEAGANGKMLRPNMQKSSYCGRPQFCLLQPRHEAAGDFKNSPHTNLKNLLSDYLRGELSDGGHKATHIL